MLWEHAIDAMGTRAGCFGMFSHIIHSLAHTHISVLRCVQLHGCTKVLLHRARPLKAMLAAGQP